jgi:pimeloyl-ACP methyl ester carboxylesterase
MSTKFVTSKDGTKIAYETAGTGPTVILVDGAFCYRQFGPAPKLAPLLAKGLRIVTYDRRGRGESTNTSPYAIEREIEDLRAIADDLGGPVSLVGFSSGAVLAMRAAAGGLDVRRLALYEPPIIVKEAPGPLQPDRKDEIIQLVAEGRNSDAVKTFMLMVGAPAIMIPFMKLMPGVWSKLTAVAPTLPHDLRILGDSGAGKSMPPELTRTMASIKVPTLVMYGSKTPGSLQYAAKAVASTVPGAKLEALDKQTHNVNPKVIAPRLIEFFGKEP